MRLIPDGWQIQIKTIAIILTIFGAQMNILFVIKVNNLVLIKWSYVSPIMLTTEPRVIIIFWAHSLISFKHLISVLGAKPNHMPLKKRFLIKRSNEIRHVYVRSSFRINTKECKQCIPFIISVTISRDMLIVILWCFTVLHTDWCWAPNQNLMH